MITLVRIICFPPRFENTTPQVRVYVYKNPTTVNANTVAGLLPITQVWWRNAFEIIRYKIGIRINVRSRPLRQATTRGTRVLLSAHAMQHDKKILGSVTQTILSPVLKCPFNILRVRPYRPVDSACKFQKQLPGHEAEVKDSGALFPLAHTSPCNSA